MLVILKRDSGEIDEQAAQILAGAIKKNPALTLGLATGGTMVGVYENLVRLHKTGSVDFSQVVTFNLDEYLGLPASHPQSFRHSCMSIFFGTSTYNPATLSLTAASAGATSSTVRRSNRLSAPPVESICSYLASAAMTTSVSTSQLPAWLRARA